MQNFVTEIILIIMIGGVIGATLAMVSNLFVIGVQWFEQQREASTLLPCILAINCSRFPPGLSLDCRCNCCGPENHFWYFPLDSPADSIYAAHQVNEPRILKPVA